MLLTSVKLVCGALVPVIFAPTLLRSTNGSLYEPCDRLVVPATLGEKLAAVAVPDMRTPDTPYRKLFRSCGRAVLSPSCMRMNTGRKTVAPVTGFTVTIGVTDGSPVGATGGAK